MQGAGVNSAVPPLLLSIEQQLIISHEVLTNFPTITDALRNPAQPTN